MPTTTTCPQCGAPAEVPERFVLESTDGPIEHARTSCARGHRFLLPVETLTRPRPGSGMSKAGLSKYVFVPVGGKWSEGDPR